MTIPCLKQLLFFVFFVGIGLPLQGNEALDAETISHVEWLLGTDSDGKETDELLAYYDANLADLPLPDVSLESLKELYAKDTWRRTSLSGVFYDFAIETYLEGDPRFQSFYENATKLADQLCSSSDINLVSRGKNAHSGFVKAAVDAGEYELALKELRKADERKRTTGYTGKMPAGFEKVMESRNGARMRLEKEIAFKLGDLERAEELILEEIEFNREKAAALPAVARSIMALSFGALTYPELAMVQAKQGESDEAMASMGKYQKLLDGAETDTIKQMKAMGVGALVDFRLASVYLNQGDPEKAFEIFSRGKKAQETSSHPYFTPGSEASRELFSLFAGIESQCLWRLRRFEELDANVAEFLDVRRNLPPHDPEIMAARKMGFWSALSQGKSAEVKNKMPDFADDQIEMVDSIFRFTPERQRLSLMQTMDPFSLFVASEEYDLLFPSILRLKGVVLDSILEDRKLQATPEGPEERNLRTRLELAKRRLERGINSGDEERIAEARQRIEELEKELSASNAPLSQSKEALQVSVEDITSKLSEKDAVLEFIQYNALTGPGETRRHYGAAIFRSGKTTDWIDLGAASRIDDEIAAFTSRMDPSNGAFDDEKISASLKELYRFVLGPLMPVIEEAESLLICPDGGLGGLSFAVLLDESGVFACDKWKIAYLSTSRDLLRTSSVPVAGGEMVIFADPEYSISDSGTDGDDLFTARAVVFDTDSLPDLAPLPGTRKEMEEISRVASSKDFSVSAFTGSDAQEIEMRSFQSSPDILHFATHGLILPPSRAVRNQFASPGDDAKTDQTNSDVMRVSAEFADNALRRSMLALAGASDTFRKWEKGEAPDPEKDGLLTAEEVATLNLRDTSLAVLSACDTGSGEAMSGEGVFGLRRGFLMAEVDHLMMTFWPIADDQTAELMKNFYHRMGESDHPATALHTSQKEALALWREEFGIGTAIYLAGPFALSTSGTIRAE